MQQRPLANVIAICNICGMEHTTPAKAIEAVGVKTLADALRLSRTTVAVWKTRNTIPRKHWPEITEAFPALTTERLLEIEKAA